MTDVYKYDPLPDVDVSNLNPSLHRNFKKWCDTTLGDFLTEFGLSPEMCSKQDDSKNCKVESNDTTQKRPRCIKEQVIQDEHTKLTSLLTDIDKIALDSSTRKMELDFLNFLSKASQTHYHECFITFSQLNSYLNAGLNAAFTSVTVLKKYIEILRIMTIQSEKDVVECTRFFDQNVNSMLLDLSYLQASETIFLQDKAILDPLNNFSGDQRTENLIGSIKCNHNTDMIYLHVVCHRLSKTIASLTNEIVLTE